jgi:hypothetical protein
MRETSVIFARSIFERHGLLGNGDLVLDVGGTPEVYYQLDIEARLSTRQRVRNTLVNMLGGQPRCQISDRSPSEPISGPLPRH